MAINKVIYGADTLIDLTEDTVDADSLALGISAHSSNGEPIVGLAPKTWTGTKAQYEAEKDNIPVGTIVNITDDYEESGNTNIYSLDEVLIGKFLDKNLYRKVFETTQATTTSQVDFNGVVIPNAKLTDVRFICETSSSQWVISGQGYLKPNGVLNARTLTASGTVVKTTVICEYVKVGT